MDAADLPIHSQLLALHAPSRGEVRTNEGFLVGSQANLSLWTMDPRRTRSCSLIDLFS